MILSRAFTSSRTSEFYTQFFKPRYETLQNAIQQTPLVVMIWGPRQRTQVWTNQRRQIQDTLRRMGHTVFFSEQLGVPITAITKKGVEFLQSETADVIVVLQSTYDAIGAVQHFSEYRVVERKMLLFIDQAATDERLYHRASEDLRAAYNNIEMFHYPTDIVHGNLIIQIVEKIKLLQLVKYCVLQKSAGGVWSSAAARWGRGRGDATALAPVNLLEAYREQRAEIDVLADSAALFVLAYGNYIGKCAVKAFAHQIGLDETTLRQTMMPLLRSQMMVHLDDTLHVTSFGRRVLASAGLVGWMAPASQVNARIAPTARPMTWARNLAFASIVILLFGLMVFYYWSSISQAQLPLQYTPTQPAVTQTLTRTPIPVR